MPGGEERLVEGLFGVGRCPAQVSDDGVDRLAVPLDELRECARASDSRALRQHVVRDERFIDLGCTDRTRAYKQDSDRTAGAQQCSCDGARVLAGAAARLEQPPRRDGFTDVSG